MSNSTNLITTEMVVDNLAEKIDAYPLNWNIACVQLGPRKLSAIWSSGVSAIQG